MGNPVTKKASQAGHLATATPLLAFLAGPHAQAIAAAWPAPHGGFLALPAARRHAAAILLARGDGDLRQLVLLVERRRDSDVAAQLVGANAPGGLIKALGRMGETLWRAVDYERFLDLFLSSAANRVLRHMDRIEPGQLRLIHALPNSLREARLVSFVKSVQAARDLGLCLHMVEVINGKDYRRRVEQAMVSSKSADSLFGKAASALQAEQFVTPTAPPPLPAHFVPVRTMADLERVALDFRNCLRDFTADIVKGQMAVYVWQGNPTGVLALRWDPAGWRLAEAEAADNEELPDAALESLVTDVVAAGIRTGPSTWSMANRLHRHIHSHESELTGWRERLQLGELWD
ncbi:MAG: hypothetical protein AAF216_07485 [Pseudomonadota bacterium]